MGESWVRCMTCNAATEMFGTDAAAIAAWNRRPALSPPAEVPFSAEDACLACNSSTPAPVDWNVVGPKLVEEMNGMAGGFYLLTKAVEAGDPKHEILFRIRELATEITDALAATQPQSNGE